MFAIGQTKLNFATGSKATVNVAMYGRHSQDASVLNNWTYSEQLIWEKIPFLT